MPPIAPLFSALVLQERIDRAKRGAIICKKLLIGAVDGLLNGDLYVTKALLRDYVNATIGFEELAVAVGGNSKGLKRMLSRNGNPSGGNLTALLKHLQEHAGIELRVARPKG